MKWIFHIILLILGLILFAVGIAILLVIPGMVKTQVEQLLPIKNGTMIYEQWRNFTVPTYMQFWFFTIDNPYEVVNGAKPALRQIGPYTYREYRLKHNIKFHDDATVSYLDRRSYVFDRERSCGDENDTLVTVNIPLLVIGNKIKNFPKLAIDGINLLVNYFEPQGIFLTTTIKDITWGYYDPILSKAETLLKKFGIHVSFDPFVGLFAKKNNSDDSIYVVDTGTINLDHFLYIKSWNGSNHLSIWDDEYANMINGTDGTLFGAFLNESSILYSFQTDLCRSIYATYVSTDIVKGIPAFNYAAPSSMLANSSVNPANAGFCVDGHCLGAGMLNLSKCIPMAPVVMSQPHFYDADEKYSQSVYGLNPSPDLSTLLKLEPTTGLPLHVQKKIQINIAMEPVPNYINMGKINSVILPVMWVNESAIIDDELASMLRQKLVIPVTVFHWLAVGLIAIGSALVLIILLVNMKRNYNCRLGLRFKIINDDHSQYI